MPRSPHPAQQPMQPPTPPPAPLPSPALAPAPLPAPPPARPPALAPPILAPVPPPARRPAQPPMQPPTPPAPLPSPALAQPPPRVLLIEDDPLQARGLQRLLQSHGALCHAVPSAEAAFLALATLPPYDLILSDLHLPGLSGAALGERLRRPLLVCYSGACELPPHFDLVLRKPAMRELLHLLGAPRLRVALAQTAAGTWQGRLLEAGLTCAAETPAKALRTLALCLEADATPPGHA